MRRHPILVLVLLLLVAAACGARSGEEPAAAPTTGTEEAAQDPTEPADEPAGEPTEEATQAPEDGGDGDGQGAGEATAFFARIDDSGVWVEPETHALDETTTGVARAAVGLLVAGDTTDPNLGSLVPAGTELLGVDISGGVLVVDFDEPLRAAGGSSTEEQALAQQLAHTAAQFDGVGAVQLEVEGAAVDELWGHLDWSQPIEPDPFALSPIDIQRPAWGATVDAGTVQLAGEANTFEATVELRLLGPDGAIIDEGFTTATSGSGERGTWSHSYEITAPGRYTIEAIEPDPSDGEGRPPLRVPVEFEVR